MTLRTTSAAVVAFALALVGWVVPARAEGPTSYTWIGSTQDSSADNHSWTDQRNWQPSGVPTNGDSVTIVQPSLSDCVAHVDAVPTVSLAQFTLLQEPDKCGSSLSGGAITVTQSFTWNGGAIGTPVVVAAGATGSISGSNATLNSLTANLTLNGSLTLNDVQGTGALIVSPPAAIHVASGAVLTSTGSNLLTATGCCIAPARLVNDGTVAISGGVFTVRNVRFDQHGTISAADGAVLDSDKAPATATGGATYTGAGTWLVEDQSTANLSGTQTLGPDFHLQLGTVGAGSGASMGGHVTLSGTGSFDWDAGTLGGQVTIGKNIRTALSGTTINNGRRILYATDPTSSSTKPTTLTVKGSTVVDNGATLQLAAGSTFALEATSLLNLAPGTTFTDSACCNNPAVLSNVGGAVAVTGATPAAPVIFNGLSYQVKGGSTSVASGQELDFRLGAPQRLSATKLLGGGTIHVASPVTLADDVQLGGGTTVSLDAPGSFNGTATLDGTGALAWTGGSMSGQLTLAPSAGTALSGTAVKSLQLASGGTASRVKMKTGVSLAAGTSSAHDLLDLGGSALVLSGNTTMPAFAEIHAGTLTNTGTLTVNAGTAHADRSGPVATTVNTGKVKVVSGTFTVANSFEQDAGSTVLDAAATLTTVHGVTIGSGVLEIHADGSGNGRVTAGTAASIAGTLRMVNESGYHPAAGESRTVLSSSALTWTGTVTTTGTGAGQGHWTPVPTATALAVVWQAI